ncbi:MAG: Inositol-1-phosphate synthase, partial [uncultured Acetobacteraceae bacterium]
ADVPVQPQAGSRGRRYRRRRGDHRRRGRRDAQTRRQPARGPAACGRVGAGLGAVPGLGLRRLGPERRRPFRRRGAAPGAERQPARRGVPGAVQAAPLARGRQRRLLPQRGRRQQARSRRAPRRRGRDHRRPEAVRGGERRGRRGDAQPRLHRAHAADRPRPRLARRLRARHGRERPRHRPRDALCLRRHQGRRPVRQLHALHRGGRAGAAGVRQAPQRARGGQGRQNRPNLDEDGAGAGLPVAGAARGRLVLHQHPRQPRRAGAGRPGQPQVQARHQGQRAGQHPRLPGRGPRRGHPLLPAARGRQGGLGQHRRHRLPRPEDADQGELPLQGQHPGGAAEPGDRAPARLGAAARERRRAGAALHVLQGADGGQRTRAGTLLPPPRAHAHGLAGRGRHGM